MKVKLVHMIMFVMALPLMAQTNKPVSFLVEVPSFTISFPDTMTLSQIDDALKTHFGTNLTFTFFATNKLTHERVKFTGNSMPNSSELEELFACQRQYDATKKGANTTNVFADLIPASQSATLTAFRKKYPQYVNIPDSQVVLTLGKYFPVYLQQDEKFAEEFAKYSAVEISSNDIEERKAAALERQADALEKQADALENQTIAQERAADAAEDQAFQQQMLNDEIDLRLHMLQIQNLTPSLTSPILPLIPFVPIQQQEQTKLIILPGQVAPIIIPPKIPGQSQLITVPGLNGPVIVPP